MFRDDTKYRILKKVHAAPRPGLTYIHDGIVLVGPSLLGQNAK